MGEERKQKIKLEKALSELEAKSLESNQQPSFTSTGMLTASSITSSDTSISSSLGREPSLPSNSEGIDCTICAEPILNYKPEYFNTIEINPACDNCKIPSDETLLQPELSNRKAAADDIEREKKEEIERVRRGIRYKVKAKLEIKLRKGEISRNNISDLEDELVKELEEELAGVLMTNKLFLLILVCLNSFLPFFKRKKCQCKYFQSSVYI